MRLARSLDPDPGTHIKTHATPDATQGESNPNCASWRRPAGRLRWCECTSVCVSRFGVSTPGSDRVLHSKMSSARRLVCGLARSLAAYRLLEIAAVVAKVVASHEAWALRLLIRVGRRCLGVLPALLALAPRLARGRKADARAFACIKLGEQLCPLRRLGALLRLTIICPLPLLIILLVARCVDCPASPEGLASQRIRTRR